MQPFNPKGPPLNISSHNHLPETEALLKHLDRIGTKKFSSNAEEVNQNNRFKFAYQNFSSEAEVVNLMDRDSENNVDDPNTIKICKGYHTSDGVIVISHNVIPNVISKKVYLLSVEQFCAIDAYPRLEGNVITPLGESGCFKQFDMLFFKRKFSYTFEGVFDGNRLYGEYIEGKTKKIYEALLNQLAVQKNAQPERCFISTKDRDIKNHCAYLVVGTATPILFKDYQKITP